MFFSYQFLPKSRELSVTATRREVCVGFQQEFIFPQLRSFGSA